MSEFDGSIWGSHPPRKENTMVKEKTEDHYNSGKQRKLKYLNKIMGELESFVERPGKEWGIIDEEVLFDLLDYVRNAIKAQISDNDEEYTG